MTMIQKINKSEMKLCIGLSLLIPLWLGLAPMWYDWYCEEKNGILLKSIYELVDNSLFINIPICFVLIYIITCWCRKIWKDNDFRYYRPILSILGIVILFCKSQVEYAKVVGNFDYRWFLTILLAIPLSINVIRFVSQLEHNINRQSQKTDSEQKGFSDDNISKQDIPVILKNYAKEIVDRLLKTDIINQSFALGVTGEWGIGKTTFLGELKKNIRDSADIVEFNPWMCSSPEQVTNDFFASLRHQLSSKYSSLSNPIKEYARYIERLSVNQQSYVSLEFLLQSKQESLYERKLTLSKQFSKLLRPVVVVIDDIDRLERDEVFEVLRLIRNTADLSNVIYMVAYDKEYVTCVLEEKNIKDSSAYLEKIFPLEIHLPKVDEDMIWKVLYTEIDAQKSSLGKGYADVLFSKFGSDDKELILSTLDNYRRAKRFARLYMLNMVYLHKNSRDELKHMDVFWLELLQMYDKKSYDVLADDENILLYRDGDRFKIRKGILRPTTDKDNIFEGSPFWKEETPRILEKLFGDYIRKIRQSVCYIENYDKYFTLSVSSFRLSIREMNELLETKEDPCKIVKKWIEDGKYPNSITYQLKQIQLEKLYDEQLKRYIHGLLYFMSVNYYNNYISSKVKNLLCVNNYTKGLNDKVHDIVNDWIKNKIENGDFNELLYLSRLLHRLYVTICYDENGQKETFNNLVLSNEEIEMLLVKVMETYLIKKPEISALEILNEKSELGKIFNNCCVMVEDNYAFTNYCDYKQLTFDTIINHFASKVDKPTFKEYEKSYASLFKQEIPDFDNLDAENDYWDYMYDQYENYMQEYFGSSYNNKLDDFKNKCFVKEKVKKEEKNTVKSIKFKQKQKIKRNKNDRHRYHK